MKKLKIIVPQQSQLLRDCDAACSWSDWTQSFTKTLLLFLLDFSARSFKSLLGNSNSQSWRVADVKALSSLLFQFWSLGSNRQARRRQLLVTRPSQFTPILPPRRFLFHFTPLFQSGLYLILVTRHKLSSFDNISAYHHITVSINGLIKRHAALITHQKLFKLIKLY